MPAGAVAVLDALEREYAGAPARRPVVTIGAPQQFKVRRKR